MTVNLKINSKVHHDLVTPEQNERKDRLTSLVSTIPYHNTDTLYHRIQYYHVIIPLVASPQGRYGLDRGQYAAVLSG